MNKLMAMKIRSAKIRQKDGEKSISENEKAKIGWKFGEKIRLAKSRLKIGDILANKFIR